MTVERITVVTGMARCGSSLTMRLLTEAGMEGVYDNDLSFETEKVRWLPEDSGWLEDCRGKAVKILEPMKFRPPRQLPYTFVFLTRNPRQQAKSVAKFMARVDGVHLDRQAVSRYRKSLERDVPRVRGLLGKYPDAEVHEFRFEDLVDRGTARLEHLERLAAVVGLEPTAERIAAMDAVVVDRPPTCLPYLREERMLGGLR